MDMNNLVLYSVLANCSISGIFALYLIISRFKLAFVNKIVLNNGFIFLNLLSLLSFLISYFLFGQSQITNNFSFTFFKTETFNLDFGFSVDKYCLLALIFSSFAFILIGIFAKLFFKKRKQFMFTKQRYYAFLSLIAFNSYVFILSSNLFQSFFFAFIQGVLILIFSYFDIFKNTADYNITRFYRISLLGDFSLLMGILLLFKYAILSKEYIDSHTLDYSQLNILFSYTYGISSSFEFKIIMISFIAAILIKFTIIPFNAYFSFFANASNLIYISIMPFVNNIFALIIFLKLSFLMEFLGQYLKYFELYLLISVIISAVLVLFEKNIKIIFAHINSMIGAIFILGFLKFHQNIVLPVYLSANLLIFIVLFALFMKEKTNLKKRTINIQKGFIIERIQISVFELIPEKIYKTVCFIDKNITQNLFFVLLKAVETLGGIFIIKNKSKNPIKNIRNILIIFALISLVSIFIALFGRFKCL